TSSPPPPGQSAPDNTSTAAPPAGPPSNPPPGTPAVVLDDQEVSTILGKSVRSNAGEDMGRIVDIIVSHDGQVRAAVIDFGGFLGIGMRKIAVDWRALNFAPGGKPGTITVDLTRNQVRLAPEYKRGEPVVVVSSAFPGQSTPSSEAAEPERYPCPAHRHAISANPSERRTTKRRRLRRGLCRPSRRSPPRRAASVA